MSSIIAEVHWHFVIGSLLLIGIFFFIAKFCIPGWRVGRQLRMVIDEVSKMGASIDLEPVFKPHQRLKHLWAEFKETLHAERAFNSRTGAMEVTELRATVPAEMFFTEDTLVHTPLRTEFFKHLPGIFTGIGIIGTFAGLLVGLSGFKVTEDPGEAREGLELLLGSVSKAFVVSASAIALAMLVTLIEKITLVSLCKRVQELTQAIDERFKAGVGEEYLARLVDASEESASQSKILKDSLVGDLKTILTEISERQIAAISTSNVQLGQQISESVAGQLKSPLEKLAAITEGVRGDQSSAVQQLVADLLARFTEKLEGLFGNQVSGMQEVQQQSIAALKEAVSQLQQMSSTVEGAGQRAGQALMEKLEQTLSKLDGRQLVMSEEMRKFVHEIRGSIGQSQSETHQSVQSLLADLARQTGTLVENLSEKSQSAVVAMGGQLEGLTVKVADAVAQMSAGIVKMELVTTDAITRMNSGADTLAIAAGDFARAGAGVTTVMAKAQEVGGQLERSANVLASATKAVEVIVIDHRTVRDTLAKMLDSLESTIESAKREASITEDVLQRLEASAAKLSAAQKSADEYLHQVTNVLATSHEAFAASMKKTLGEGNREFLNGISSATKMLREVIVELESALGNALPWASGRAS